MNDISCVSRDVETSVSRDVETSVSRDVETSVSMDVETRVSSVATSVSSVMDGIDLNCTTAVRNIKQVCDTFSKCKSEVELILPLRTAVKKGFTKIFCPYVLV